MVGVVLDWGQKPYYVGYYADPTSMPLGGCELAVGWWGGRPESQNLYMKKLGRAWTYFTPFPRGKD